MINQFSGHKLQTQERFNQHIGYLAVIWAINKIYMKKE
jgi:hypothetical protein